MKDAPAAGASGRAAAASLAVGVSRAGVSACSAGSAGGAGSVATSRLISGAGSRLSRSGGRGFVTFGGGGGAVSGAVSS